MSSASIEQKAGSISEEEEFLQQKDQRSKEVSSAPKQPTILTMLGIAIPPERKIKKPEQPKPTREDDFCNPKLTPDK